MHRIAYLGHFLIVVVCVLAVFWLARRRALPSGSIPNTAKSVLLVGVAVVVGGLFEILSFQASSPPDRFWDFLNAYYPAGQAALHHDAAMLQSLIGRGVSGFVNIPIVAYLFAPFAWLPPQMAAAAFAVIGVGLTVAAWFLLVRLAGLELRERWLLALLFLVNGPLINGIKFGNLSYFILFALAAGLLLLRAGHATKAGALLGLAAVIKPPLALFGFFFLFRRNFRGLFGFAIVGIGTAVLSLAVFGWADNLRWFETCIVQYSHSWLSAFSVQSISAFIIRLRPGIGIDYIDSLPRLPTPGENLVSMIVTGLLFVTAALACIMSARRPAQDDQVETRLDLQYILVVCLVLVASPLSWDRYYSWLLLPTAFFLGSMPRFPSSRIANGLAWLAVSLVTPLVIRPNSLGHLGDTTAYKMFFVSHLLFGGLLWFGVVAWWLARSGGRFQPSLSTAAPEKT